MLISGFFFLFVACIVYMHADMSISKSSASYLAKLQWDEVSVYCGNGIQISGIEWYVVGVGASNGARGGERGESMLSDSRQTRSVAA